MYYDITLELKDAIVLLDWETIRDIDICIDMDVTYYIHESGTISTDSDAFNGWDAVQLSLLDDDMADHVCDDVIEIRGSDLIARLVTAELFYNSPFTQDSTNDFLQWVYNEVSGC